jgi:pseudouridine synthase
LSIRLNKLLATRGVAARRKCDELIASGAVSVNGEVVREPGARIEPERDRVLVNGKPIARPPRLHYYVLNKPVGMISTMSDPRGRRSLAGVLPRGVRVFPVGRLDADTSGLLILTNDGDLAHHLMHPRYGVDKLYRVVVRQHPSEAQIEKLARGVVFEPGVRSAPARVRVRTPVSWGEVIEIVLSEGRYRQVRRMCEAVGLEVLALHRWGYGPLRLGELERGMWRELSEEEVGRLRAAAARPAPRGAPRRPRRAKPRRKWESSPASRADGGSRERRSPPRRAPRRPDRARGKSR